MSPPRVLTIAGSDPSGGAGVQADLKTFHAQGCYGMAVLTALTAQNTVCVSAIHTPPAEFVGAQIDAVFGDCPPAACKTGMLASEAVVAAVADRLARYRAPNVVVDPVMVATSGDRLLAASAEVAVVEQLLPLATIVTPNAAEATVLTGIAATDRTGAVHAARRLVELGARAVLVKGGDNGGDHAEDVYFARGDPEPVVLSLPRVPLLTAAHGTGCTLSAAIAAALAHGRPLLDAVREAKRFVHTGLTAAFAVGAGAVPVNHFAAGRER